jgi:hypothetical protein
MKFKFLIGILLSQYSFSAGLATYDLANDLSNGEQIAQGIKTYKEIKKQFKEIKKQTDILNKQVESFNGIRTSISNSKQAIYSEIHYWEDAIQSTENSMRKLQKTIKSTPENAKSMFDTSDGNYYNGRYKNMKIDEFLKEIKLNVEKGSSEDTKLGQMSLTKEFKKLGKVFGKGLTPTNSINFQQNLELEKLKKSWGDTTSGEMWREQLFLASEQAEKESESKLKVFNALYTKIKTETTVYGQSTLTNRMLVRLLVIAEENLKSAKKYRTAMLGHFYKLASNKSLKLDTIAYIEKSRKLKRKIIYLEQEKDVKNLSFDQLLKLRYNRKDN